MFGQPRLDLYSSKIYMMHNSMSRNFRYITNGLVSNFKTVFNRHHLLFKMLGDIRSTQTEIAEIKCLNMAILRAVLSSEYFVM